MVEMLVARLEWKMVEKMVGQLADKWESRWVTQMVGKSVVMMEKKMVEMMGLILARLLVLS